MLADALVQEFSAGGAKALRVAVAGGGVAGFGCAARLCELEAETALLESQENAFAIQRLCNFRWIDPFLYEWPLSPWTERSFPIVGLGHTKVPLNINRGVASDLAEAWATAVNRFCIEAHLLKDLKDWAVGTINLALNTELVAFRNDVSAVHFQCRKRTSASTYDDEFVSADLLVLALGAKEDTGAGVGGSGRVRHAPPSFSEMRHDPGWTVLPREDNQEGFEGPKFWEPDGLSKNSTLTSSRGEFGARTCDCISSARSVLIAGGGDGALQDLQRVLCGAEDTRELLKEIAGASDARFTGVASELAPLEANWKRLFPWNSGAEHDCIAHSQLDQITGEVAKDYLAGIDETARSSLWDRLRRGSAVTRNIHLVHRCAHVAPYYGINRLIFHVLNHLAQEYAPGLVTVRQKCDVSAVKSACDKHICGHLEDCLRHAHSVELSHGRECRRESSSDVFPETRSFYPVLVRFGILRKDIDPIRALRGRQNPPFHLPHRAE